MDRTVLHVTSHITSVMLVTLSVVAFLMSGGCTHKPEATSGASSNSQTGNRQIGAGEDGKVHVMQGNARGRKNTRVYHTPKT